MAHGDMSSGKDWAMDETEYLRHVRADGTHLGEAARRGRDASITSCPGWSMDDLVGHVGSVHHWVTGTLRHRAQSGQEAMQFRETAPETTSLMDWYDEGVDGLIAQLEVTDPQMSVWNWRDNKPAEARFWFRRMAQETVVHRFDAEEAIGVPGPLAPDLCADGIDEFLSFVTTWLSREPDPALRGTFALAATDSPLRCTLRLSGDRLETEPDLDESTPTLWASTQNLFLWMVHRRSIDDPGNEVTGDPRAFEPWATVTF
jgi:uncharacterized protein (TIGR03083 family)